MMRTFLLLGSLALAGVLLIGAAASRTPLAHHIVVSTTSAEYTLAMLIDSADTIAIVRPTGNDRVHWNSADNSAWTSDQPGRAMIYNDQDIEIVNVLRGAKGTSVVRNIGGTVGDTEYELEGLEPLKRGIEYLVFLKAFDTPTREGMERAVSFVGQNQGVFTRSGQTFVNNLGLSVKLADLGQ